VCLIEPQPFNLYLELCQKSGNGPERLTPIRISVHTLCNWESDGSSHWSELATLEKALFEFEPRRRIVPTTITRMTASMTAYSAMS